MTICIIPARGGSKRIKNKNIKKINGVPLIGTVIKLAKQSKIFKRVIVSTDSEKISKIAKTYGAEVPFLRNKKLSNDYTPVYKVLVDAVKKLKLKDEYIFCIYPTAIFIKKLQLIESFKKIKKTKANQICSIYKNVPNPLRSFKMQGKYIKYFLPKYQMKRSQDLPSIYTDAGTFVIYRRSALLKIRFNSLMPSKTTYYILKSNLGVDINTMDDFKKAKQLYTIKKKIN